MDTEHNHRKPHEANEGRSQRTCRVEAPKDDVRDNVHHEAEQRLEHEERQQADNDNSDKAGHMYRQGVWRVLLNSLLNNGTKGAGC